MLTPEIDDIVDMEDSGKISFVFFRDVRDLIGPDHPSVAHFKAVLGRIAAEVTGVEGPFERDAETELGIIHRRLSMIPQKRGKEKKRRLGFRRVEYLGTQGGEHHGQRSFIPEGDAEGYEAGPLFHPQDRRL
jgi:hypothetical protein